MSIHEAERKQDKFDGLLSALSVQSAKSKEYIEAKNKLLNNAKSFYKGREKIIEGFKNGIFSFNYDETEEEELRDKEEENNIRDNNGLIDYKKLNRLINLKERGKINELVKKHFLVQDLGALPEKFRKSKNNKEKNKIQVVLDNSTLRDLKEDIEDMSEQEKEIERPDVIVDIVEKILEFNNQ